MYIHVITCMYVKTLYMYMYCTCTCMLHMATCSMQQAWYMYISKMSIRFGILLCTCTMTDLTVVCALLCRIPQLIDATAPRGMTGSIVWNMPILTTPPASIHRCVHMYMYIQCNYPAHPSSRTAGSVTFIYKHVCVL